jgi:phosphatidate cytidylyltransferase
MDLKQRIITGVIAGIGFFLLLYAGSFWFAGLILILSVIGYDEFLRMNELKSNKAITLLGYAGVVALALPWEKLGVTISLGHLMWLLLFIFMVITVLSKNKVTIDHIAMMVVGMVYVGIGFHYMITTRLIEDSGLFWTLLIFLCIWATDSGAYFTGTWLGRTPLWPTISPKKSIEGSIGGTVISVLIAISFAWFRPELLSLGQAILLGITVAVIGQMGDLIQSAYKRVKGIKDTGTLLPGHGGVLDRTDSWIIVFPFVHLAALIPQM